MDLRVGTFNILNTCGNYPARKPFISKTIKEMDCDILGLQEVNLKGNTEIHGFSEYNFEFHHMPSSLFLPIPDFRIDGNGILLKKEIEILERYELKYSLANRVALALRLKKSGVEFIFVNTHLDYLADFIRGQQVTELVLFLEQFKEMPLVCVGDFNMTPDSSEYLLMSQCLTSSNVLSNGKEPFSTYPTPLEGVDIADLPPMCIDYIWVNSRITTKKCEVFIDCGLGNMWASDHFPVVADLQI